MNVCMYVNTYPLRINAGLLMSSEKCPFTRSEDAGERKRKMNFVCDTEAPLKFTMPNTVALFQDSHGNITSVRV